MIFSQFGPISYNKTDGADGVKTAVLRKDRAGSVFI